VSNETPVLPRAVGACQRGCLLREYYALDKTGQARRGFRELNQAYAQAPLASLDVVQFWWFAMPWVCVR
jgi:hypothetical protein